MYHDDRVLRQDLGQYRGLQSRPDFMQIVHVLDDNQPRRDGQYAHPTAQDSDDLAGRLPGPSKMGFI